MAMQIHTPANEAELGDTITAACNTKTPLEVLGNGTKRGLGFEVKARPLSLSAIAGIVSYEPEEMVITVKAGTSLAHVQNALKEHRQCLAFEPSTWSSLWGHSGDATIGGTIAASVSGPRRFASGGPRDHLLGFSAINGKGECFKAGGKVVKNVTGYDLSKLAVGSFGTLFVMTELTLRAVPAAQKTIGVVMEGLSVGDALGQLRKVAMSPLEPSGLSFLPASSTEPSLALCRFEGDEAGAAARAQEAQKRLGQQARIMTEANTIEIFARINNLLSLFDNDSNLWRISLPPVEASNFMRTLNPEKFVADGAGGTLWVQSNSQEVHQLAESFGGHAIHMRRSSHSIPAGDIFQPLNPALAHLTTQIKDAFDPHRILNPGRMYKEI